MIRLIVPPMTGGVRDFAGRLGDALGTGEAVVEPLAAGNDVAVTPGDIVFVQLSGYGFQRRGAPVWLLARLSDWRRRGAKVGVFFHELYAFGPPWTSAFWMSALQRRVSRRAAETADFWMTSREASASWLRRFAADKPHAVLPVFSNIGEAPASNAARAPKIVVFGSAGLRKKMYDVAGSALFEWTRRHALDVHDVGPMIGDAGTLATLQSNRVVCHGRLDPADVSSLLRDARYGALAYPVDYVAKSGVFAAYCAHGLCTILLSPTYPAADGLLAGRHYLAAFPAGAHAPADAADVGVAAWNWYQPHCLPRHVEELRRMLDAVR